MARMFAMSVGGGVLFSMQFLVFLSLAIGGLMFLGVAAIFGGHHDGEMGHDMEGGDHDAGHGGESAGGPSFLSPRVFFAFLTGFGVAGAIATIYGAGAGIATGVGFIPGFIMAFVAWGVAYFLYKEQVNSSIRPGQVVGSVGTVVTTIQSGSLGEVNVSVNGQILPYTAISEDGTSHFQVGTRVKVVRDLGDKVTVSRETPGI